jgi:hypothetical protein
MVDDVFRSYRNHNTAFRKGSEVSRGGIGDLLAELAQLTGQGDPYRDGGRDDGSFQAREDGTFPAQRQRGEDRYVAPSRRQPSPLPREHQTKPPSNRYPSRPSVINGCGKGSDQSAVNKLQHSGAGQQSIPSRDDRQPVLPRPQAPTFLPAVSDDRRDHEMQSAETDEIHRADSFCNALPRPRWGRAMVIAVLGLAWLGAASAFSYFAVFGGEPVLPTLPPLVAADNGPKEIVPNYGDARSNNLSQRSMVNASSSEKFVSRWPADNQEPPKTALTSSDPTTLRPAASTPSPSVAPLAVMAPSVPASERKKVHTIIIRSGGSEQTDTSAAVAHSATSAKALGMR